MSEFLKRPQAGESDDDLLRMQEEWQASQKKSSVAVHKMKKKAKTEKIEQKAPTAPKLSKSHRDQAARFQIDLDDIREESTVQDVLFGVQERNIDWLREDKTDEIAKIASTSTIYSKDDGFPEPLDLSAYYGTNCVRKSFGKSFFAAEFDRIHGNLAENLENQAENEEETGKPDDFETENEKYLRALDADKILELRKEVEERFDPKLLEFLAKRGKAQKTEVEKKKVSKFKAQRKREKEEPEAEHKLEEIEQNEPENTENEQKTPKIEEKQRKLKENDQKQPETPAKPEIEDMMNELEVLEEWKNREDQEKYNRLATDAIQLDLTAKFSRNLAARQQKNAVKLFDNCRNPPQPYIPDGLLETARSQLDAIKLLYLEEISQDGQVSYQFGKGVNPILDNCWTLQPVRRVLDAVEKRQGRVTVDDVEIVRLAILWTLLLFEERKSAFFAFAEPNDFYVHLSELYLIGAEVLADDVISEASGRILKGYVLPAARDGKICLRMSGKCAGLDAFMPFFENMLKNYEQYSMGDEQFAMAILVGAYLNVPVGDSIEYRFSLWSAKRNTIRQMTVSPSSCRDLLEAIKTQICEREAVIYEQHYVQYCSLLGAYVAAIRDDVITRDRNPLLFEIAASEIGKFLQKQQKSGDPKHREFQILVDIIQKSIGDKLMVL